MLTASLLIAVSLASGVQAASAPQCSSASVLVSACTSNTGTQVNVGGSQGSSGSGGSTNSPGRGQAPRGDNSAPAPEEEAEQTQQNCGPNGDLCRAVYSVEVLPDVTASDLASFVPATPSFDAEPGGAGIVGMPTNFVATATAQTQAGTLFDRPVTVHFEPAGYVFDYGDGTSSRSATGGAAWTSLGQPQFTATPTSHAYGARGTYTAAVTVEYAASVNFGTGWRPVIGVVRSTAGGQAIDIYEARTALVDRTCAEEPADPGC